MNTSSPIKTIFLDAGGVLVHPNWDRIAETLTRHGIPANGAALADAEPHVTRQMDSPEYFTTTDDDTRWPMFINAIIAHAGGPVPLHVLAAPVAELKDYHDRENLWETVPPEVVPALIRLKAGGYRLVVVSNANGTVKMKMERLGLARYFDHILDSFEEGVEKPDPRFFRIALERSGSQAESTVHVGDLYHIDVVGARAASLRAVLMDPVGLQKDRDCPRIAHLGELDSLIRNWK